MVVSIEIRQLFWKRKITLRFDIYSWLLMCEMNEIEFHEISKLPGEVLMNTLIYSAYVSNQRYNAKKLRYDPIEFEQVWKQVKHSDVKRIVEAIETSKIFGKTTEQWAALAAEKKK